MSLFCNTQTLAQFGAQSPLVLVERNDNTHSAAMSALSAEMLNEAKCLRPRPTPI